jgi:nucleotide-binding universal stress UspA family protein
MPPFTSILCGVEGHPESTEAVRQAIALATQGARLHFLAVHPEFELDPATYRESLEASLDEAMRMADEAGVEATCEMHDGRYAVDVLLAVGRAYDVLVIGTHNNSRLAGIFLGSTASEAVHDTERPLLIARPLDEESAFPRSILVATDGSEESWAPCRTAAGLAASFDSELAMVHVGNGEREERRHAVEEQVAAAGRALGSEPELIRQDGRATDSILRAAGRRNATLLVVGRRGLKGLKALGSVSERIVHGARCSVLLVPGA